jgi:hypothetical protein
MATPTKRHMNWQDVIFTDTASAATTITGVTSIDIDMQGSKKEFSGDADQFVTTLVHDFSNPQITVQSADLAAIQTMAPGLRGSFTATHLDAKNADTASSGGYTVAMTHCMVNNNPTGGKHREFGEGSFILTAESTDGTTSPISFSAL